MTRTTEAFTEGPLLDVAGDPVRLLRMGPNWTRAGMRQDPRTGLWIPGTLLEPARTNLCLQSQTIDNGIWAKTRASVTNTTTCTDPYGLVTVNDVLHEDGTATQNHYIAQAVTTGAVNCCWSAFAKAINRNWLMLRGGAATIPRAYFDLSAGVVGASASILSAGLIPYGNDWWLIWMAYLADAGAQNYYAYICDSDDDWADFNAFDGADQDSLYFRDSQIEVGLFPSSRIVTTTGTVQRTADSAVVRETGLVDNTFEWAVQFPIIIPEHAPAADTLLLSLKDSSNPGTDFTNIYTQSATGKVKVWNYVGGSGPAPVGSTANIADGNMHWITVSLRPGELAVWVDGVLEAIDTTVSAGDCYDQLSAHPSGAWTGGVEILPHAVSRPWQPIQPQTLAA